MKLRLRFENDYEETLFDNSLAPVGLIIIGILSVLWAGLLAIVIVDFGLLWLIWGNETMTIDKGLKNIIIEHRWQKTKKLNFSDIKEINIIEEWGEWRSSLWINLITIEGSKVIWVGDDAKKIGIKICKEVGVNGQIVSRSVSYEGDILTENSTPLIGAT